MADTTALIKATPLDDTGKATLYDKFYASKSSQELTSYLDSTPLPKEVKAQLWDQWNTEVKPYYAKQSAGGAAPIAPVNPPEKPGVLSSLARGAVSGVVQGTMGTIGGLAQLAGDVTGIEGLQKLGQEYTGTAETLGREIYGQQGENRVGGFAQRGAEVFTDPSWWAQTAGEGMGNLLTMIASGGVTKAAIDQAIKRGLVTGTAAKFAQSNAPAIVAGGVGGVQAAANTYAQAKASGADDATALKAAGMDFVQNAALGAAGAKMGMFGGGSRGATVARTAVAEPATNVAQAGLSNLIAQQTFDPNRSLQEGVVEGVVQGAAAAVPGGVAGSKIQARRPQADAIVQELAPIVQNAATMDVAAAEGVIAKAIDTLDTLVPGTPEYQAVVDAATQAETALTQRVQTETRRADQDRLKQSLQARQALRNAKVPDAPPERPSTALESASVLMGVPEGELQRMAAPPPPETPGPLPDSVPPMAGAVGPAPARPAPGIRATGAEAIPVRPEAQIQGGRIPLPEPAPPPEPVTLPQNVPPMATEVIMPRPATPEARPLQGSVEPIAPRRATFQGREIAVPEPPPTRPAPPPEPLPANEPPMAGVIMPKPKPGEAGMKAPEPKPVEPGQAARVKGQEIPMRKPVEKPPEEVGPPSEIAPPMARAIPPEPMKGGAKMKVTEPAPMETAAKPKIPDAGGKLAKLTPAEEAKPPKDVPKVEEPGTVKLKAEPVEKPVEIAEKADGEQAPLRDDRTMSMFGDDERSDAELQAQDIARNRGEELKAVRAEAAENVAGVGGVPGSKNTPYAEPYKAARVPVSDIAVHPEDFQYKEITDLESGTGEALKSVKQWDEDKAGVISLWYDPARKENVVINGHHRLALAKRVGQKDVLVKYIRADSPAEARIIGALINIADDKGTAMDAARIMREVKMDPKLFDMNRLDIEGRVASDGLGLANLTDTMWRRVETGEIPPDAGAVIGKNLDAGKQGDFWNFLRKENETARDMILSNRRRLKSLVDRANAATEKEVVSDQGNLFGMGELRSSFKEEADLVDYVSERLSTDKKLFSMVSNSRNAQQLMESGNVLDMSQNERKKALEAAIKRGFNKLSNLAGPLNRMIQQNALNLMDETLTQKQVAEIREQSYEEARRILVQELGLERDSGTEGTPGIQQPAGDQGKARAGNPPKADRGEGREAEDIPEGSRVKGPPVEVAQPEIEKIQKSIDAKQLDRSIKKAEDEFSELTEAGQGEYFKKKLEPIYQDAQKRIKLYKVDTGLRDRALQYLVGDKKIDANEVAKLEGDAVVMLQDLTEVYRYKLLVENKQPTDIIAEMSKEIGRSLKKVAQQIEDWEQKTYRNVVFGG